jgi:hypothetical protein
MTPSRSDKPYKIISSPPLNRQEHRSLNLNIEEDLEIRLRRNVPRKHSVTERDI